MPEFQHDSYCGLYCGACEIMHQFKKSLETGIEAKREYLPPIMQKYLPVPQNTPIICYGCKSDTVFLGCSKCPIRKCAKEKPEIEICSQCGKYPCFRFKLFKLMMLMMNLKGLHKKWSHLSTSAPNLVTIKKIGREAWLKEQEEYWSCLNCHSKRYWYSKDCEC